MFMRANCSILVALVFLLNVCIHPGESSASTCCRGQSFLRPAPVCLGIGRVSGNSASLRAVSESRGGAGVAPVRCSSSVVREPGVLSCGGGGGGLVQPVLCGHGFLSCASRYCSNLGAWEADCSSMASMCVFWGWGGTSVAGAGEVVTRSSGVLLLERVAL